LVVECYLYVRLATIMVQQVGVIVCRIFIQIAGGAQINTLFCMFTCFLVLGCIMVPFSSVAGGGSKTGCLVECYHYVRLAMILALQVGLRFLVCVICARAGGGVALIPMSLVV
jgi:hypothetical protein